MQTLPADPQAHKAWSSGRQRGWCADESLLHHLLSCLCASVLRLADTRQCFTLHALCLISAAVQVAEVVEESAKLEWVASRLQGWIDQGDVLMFASRREQVDILTDKLKARSFR